VRQELWGIDDPSAEREIHRAVRRRCLQSAGLTVALLVPLAVGVMCAAVAMKLAHTLLLRSLPCGLLAGAVCGWISAALGQMVAVKRYGGRALAEVLHERCRCTTCGYKLPSSADAKCPECGSDLSAGKNRGADGAAGAPGILV